MSWETVGRSNGFFSTSSVSGVIALALGLFVVAFFIVRPSSTPGPVMRDFEAYYAAGATANRAADPYSRAIWAAEREVPGVDPSHDETLPFVGPAAGLALWRALALLPFDLARRVWGAVLGFGMLVVIFGSLALAGASRTVATLCGAAILAGSYGPLTSDAALGQVALLGGAGVVLALVLLRTHGWLAASAATALAALQPNLALVLIARATGARAWIALALGFLIFAAVTLADGGAAGIARYVDLLRDHGDAERFTVIQITPGAIAYGFGAGQALAAMVRGSIAFLALAAAGLAMRRVAEPEVRVGIAICALPFFLPFFHEHDFLLAILPATLCAVRARGATLALASVGTVACGADWLGLAQRPSGELQTAVLAAATTLGFALIAGLRAHAFAGFIVPLAIGALSPIARAHLVPIWPDALPPHWQPPPGASISRVWELEQHVAGLTQTDPAWAMLRSWSLLGSGLLGVALSLTGLRYRRS